MLCSLGLPLGLEASVMTPNAVSSVSFFNATCLLHLEIAVAFLQKLLQVIIAVSMWLPSMHALSQLCSLATRAGLNSTDLQPT